MSAMPMPPIKVGSVDQLDGDIDCARHIEDVGSGIDFSQEDNAARESSAHRVGKKITKSPPGRQ